jgi:broad specificity phosphatase PhoE
VDSKNGTEGHGWIYLVRHAKSEANDLKKYTGWLDVDLSDRGKIEAIHSKRLFDGMKVDSVYSSTLKRAYETAEIIFGDGITVKQLDDFKELNVGAFEMKTHDELMTEYPDLYTGWITDPTTSTPPDGENLYDYYDRVARGFGEVLRDNIGKTAVIVAHGGVIRCIVLHVLNMKLNDIWKIKVDNLSVSLVQHYGEKRALTLLNDTCHLCGVDDG